MLFSFFKTDFFQRKLLAAQYLFIPGAAFGTDIFVLHDVVQGMAVTAQSLTSDADHLQLASFEYRPVFNDDREVLVKEDGRIAG